MNNISSTLLFYFSPTTLKNLNVKNIKTTLTSHTKGSTKKSVENTVHSDTHNPQSVCFTRKKQNGIEFSKPHSKFERSAKVSNFSREKKMAARMSARDSRRPAWYCRSARPLAPNAPPKGSSLLHSKIEI